MLERAVARPSLTHQRPANADIDDIEVGDYV